MKNKYQRMPKTEKKALEQKFKKTEYGKNLLYRLNRLLIIGLIGIGFSILEFIVAIFNKKDIFDFIAATLLLIISIIFITSSIKTKNKQLNNYALKQK